MVVAEEGGNDVVNDRTAHNVVDNPPESVASEQGLSTANGAQRKQKTFKISIKVLKDISLQLFKEILIWLRNFGKV